MSTYAQHFFEIEDALKESDELSARILDLVANEPIPGKVTEGGDRVESLRSILTDFFNGSITLEEARDQIRQDLPRRESPHAHDNRTFPDGWAERLARTQISRFYNKAVLTQLKQNGADRAYVPHSDHEDIESPCTNRLAGGSVDIDTMLERLNRAYRDGEWHDQVMIPEHPHCTHTFVPDSS